MCLAIPGEIIEILAPDDLLRPSRVSFDGIIREVSLAYLPEAQVGDYVLVHVGFAISILDAVEAQKVFTTLKEALDLEPDLKREISS